MTHPRRVGQRFISLVASALALLALIVAPAESAAQSPIKVGLSLPFDSAPEASAEMRNGVEIYIDSINSEGGIDGREIELIAVDDQNDPKQASRVARDLEKQGVVAVIGHFWSSAATGATEIYDEAGLVNIVPVANDPEVTRGSDWVFGMHPPTNLEGQFMATYLKHVVGVDRVAVIAGKGAYGTSLQQAFLQKAERIGLDVDVIVEFDGVDGIPGDLADRIRSEPSTDSGEEDSQRRELGGDESENSALESTADPPPEQPEQAADSTGAVEPSQPDAVLIASLAGPGKKAIELLRQGGIDAPILTPSAFAEDASLPGFHEEYVGELFATTPFLFQIANQQATRFKRRYQSRYGSDPGTQAAFANDSARVLVEALRAVGPDRQRVRDYLGELRGDNSTVGITGTLSFDEHGAIVRSLYVTGTSEGLFKVAFEQLLPVRQAHLYQSPEDEPSVIVEDGAQFHLTDVVYVGIDHFRVEKINPKTFGFDMELFMWFKWKGDAIDTEDLTLVNGVYGIDDLRYVIREQTSGPINYRAFRIKSGYLTPFELHDFPFDTQVLSLKVAHKTQHSRKVILVPDRGYMLTQKPRIYDPEWSVHQKRTYSELYRYPSKFGDPRMDPGIADARPDYFSSVNVDLYVQRKSFPHVISILLPLFLILTVTLIVFSVTGAEFSLKLSIGMTALLSLLVFHLAQGQSLPNVGYLTKADMYFIAAYVWMSLLFGRVLVEFIARQRGRELFEGKLNLLFTAFVAVGVVTTYSVITWYV